MIQNREREILYVDDTEEQRYVMKRILEGAGYRVVEAATGAEALARVRGDMLAVVLDVKLPDMSGYEVCRRIKADPATSMLPILQISASFVDPVLRVEGLSGGADAYVAQPVHPAELLTLVAALIRSREAEKTLRFQAEVSRRLASSLDYLETLHIIETAFVPRFADRCSVVVRDHGGTQPEYESTGLTLDLREKALTAARDGVGHAVSDRVLVAPMAVGRKAMGALIFECDGEVRHYEARNLALAQDLADRAALALQNATLYSAQQTTQAALVQSEKLAAAGRLSAAIAHEINNPLESITNLMYLMDTSEEITPTLKGYVQEAMSEMSRLTHIARQSLGFYRELTGPAVFDLNESLEDTLEIYLKRFGAKDILVERHYAPGPLTMKGVKGEVRQVISNLLVNAYDALDAGGTLTVETGQTADGKFAFRVIDNGMGMAEDVLARIFEPFFTTKQGTGTGLGLWVSETIVNKHGGTIVVTSEVGRGTRFEVVLPEEWTEL